MKKTPKIRFLAFRNSLKIITIYFGKEKEMLLIYYGTPDNNLNSKNVTNPFPTNDVLETDKAN